VRRAATGLALGLAVAAGCGNGGGATVAPTACVPGDHEIAGVTLHLPPGARSGARLPLVIGLHGAGGTGEDFDGRVGLSTYGDEQGFATVFPTAASSRRFWSLNGAASPDDVPRIEALLDAIETLGCTDPERVYATGVSNGGGFAARLGCELSDRIAAVAPVAGGYRALDRCPSTRRSSLLEIHGLADHVVPYRGIPPDFKGNVPRFVARWARRHGCAPRPVRTHPSRGVTRLRYHGCEDGTAVEHIAIAGLDHGWVARGEPADVDANEEIWRFFRDKRRVS
jgi:polyhydroxybutyrate depolymerase